MAKRKVAKDRPEAAMTTAQSVEPLIVSLAGQLGTLLGKARGTADGWLESEAVRKQVSQIRDGATQLMEQVNKAGTAARKTAVTSGAAAFKTAVKAGTAARKTAVGLMPGAKAKKAKKSTAATKAKNRSGGTVDAPGKRHRKPPPDELFDKRLGEPMGTQMGQKNLKRRGQGDR